jgi:hypothetical protein
MSKDSDSDQDGAMAMANETLRRLHKMPPKPHKEKGGADTPRRPTKRKITSSSKDSSASKEES